MTNMENGSAPLWTRGMIAVLIAQFLSAMALSIGTLWLHRRWQTRLAVSAS